MRRLVTWGLVTLGIAALARRWKHRREGPAPVQQPTTPTATVDDPAGELRRKLAETRSQDDAAAAEVVPDETVADRRAEVHDEGRAALEEMRSRQAGD
jgi:hypothetical protein